MVYLAVKIIKVKPKSSQLWWNSKNDDEIFNILEFYACINISSNIGTTVNSNSSATVVRYGFWSKSDDKPRCKPLALEVTHDYWIVCLMVELSKSYQTYLYLCDPPDNAILFLLGPIWLNIYVCIEECYNLHPDMIFYAP